MKKEQFDRLFYLLVANPWRYKPEKASIENMRCLFASRLCKFEYLLVREVFDEILDDKSRESIPMVQAVVGMVEAKIEALHVRAKPKRVVRSEESKARIRRMFVETRRIITSKGIDHKAEIRTMVGAL